MKVDIKKRDYTVDGDGGGEQTEVIHMLARDEDGNRIHLKNREHNSYFYVPTEEVDADLKLHVGVQKLEDGYNSIRDEELTRVYTYKPGDVPTVRSAYTHYEADILYPNRFSIDTGIYGGVEIPDMDYSNPREIDLDEINKCEFYSKPRIIFCDIEVDDEHGFPNEEEAREEVVCISMYDNFEEEYYVFLYHEDEPDADPQSEYAEKLNVTVYDTEVKMLSAFADKLLEFGPDVIAGWNFKKFDAMYLISRFDRLDELAKGDLSPLGSAYNDGWFGGKIRGISVFDMLKAYKNLQFTELDSFSLEDVAREELSIGKLESENESIHEMWTTDVDALLEYNIRDVYLTVKLEETQDIIKFYEEVANFVGGRLPEVVDYSKAADIYVLNVVNDEFAVPSMDTVTGGEEEFEGAEVFDPVTEIKEMISVLDLASLYPFSMKTLNAGPRTKDPNGQITAPNGVSFTTETKSIITEIIDSLLEEREEKKRLRNQYSPGTLEYGKYDRQQRAVKIIMNTIYGILGWSRFRLYDEDVAASVTAVGREVIKFTEQKVSEMGYDVIYGDTDSVMIEMDDAEDIHYVIYVSLQLEELINASYDEFAKEELNTEEHYFEIEFEKIYRRFIQAGKKKRYAGHIVWKDGKETDSIDIVGLEFQRSDYSTAAKELQKQVINLMLMGAERDEIGDFIRDSIEKIKNLEYDLDELGIPGGIGQDFDSYVNKPKHVRGAEYANEHLEEQIQPGDKPKGIYVERIPNYLTPPQLKDSKFICWMNPDNVPDETVYDWDKYLSIQVDNPLSTIFECTEWSWDAISSGQTQTRIGSFGEETENEVAMFETDNDLSQDRSTRSRRRKTTTKPARNNNTNSVSDYDGTDDELSIFETSNDLSQEKEEDDDTVETEEPGEIEVIDFDDIDEDINKESKEEEESKELQSGISDF